jgi:hypothetical protein
MSLVAAPPIRPHGSARTNQKPLRYYTIHSHANDAFTLKIDDTTRTSVVSFRKWDDALLIGKMIETHYIQQKEWPDTRQVGSLVLPNSRVGDVLKHVYMQEWDYDELKVMCTENTLDMITVDAILKKKSSYSFAGSQLRFEAPTEFYRMRFDQLFTLSLE